MGARILVDDRYITAQDFLIRLVESGIEVQSAFWVIANCNTTGVPTTTAAPATSGSGWVNAWVASAETTLYIVSKAVNEKGLAWAYSAVNSVLRKMPESMVTTDDIKLIGPTHALAVDVMAISKNSPRSLPIRLTDRLIGGIIAQEVYIYPTPLFRETKPTESNSEKMLHELVPLFNRGTGVLKPTRVTLRDGSVFDGVPFSLQLGDQQGVLVQFVVAGRIGPRMIKVDEIASLD